MSNAQPKSRPASKTLLASSLSGDVGSLGLTSWSVAMKVTSPPSSSFHRAASCELVGRGAEFEADASSSRFGRSDPVPREGRWFAHRRDNAQRRRAKRFDNGQFDVAHATERLFNRCREMGVKPLFPCDWLFEMDDCFCRSHHKGICTAWDGHLAWFCRANYQVCNASDVVDGV